MVGTGSRFFFALAVVGFVLAGAYGVATGGDPIGVMSMGYKGGVGEHFGYAVLTFLGSISLVLGLVSVAVRDADPVPVAAGGGEALPEVPVPSSASPWPLVGAVGAMVAALGLVVGWPLFALGLVLVAITAIEWAVKVWADRATGDPAVNLSIRNRLMAPIEIPLAAALVIAFMVIGVSRVFLAVSPTTAWVLASIVGLLIILGAVIVVSRPQHTSRVATALLLLLALGVLGGGIAGVAAGEREFHEHEPAHEAEEHE
jgi:hypothetical protein